MFGFNSKRKLSNVTLTKRFHLKYHGWWFIVSLCMIAVLFACLWLLFEESWLDVVSQNSGAAADYFFSRSRYVPMLVLVAFLLMIGITGLGIMTTHRIAGPLIKLQKAFDEVRSGNLDYRLKFRQEDELSDLAQSFNEMMEKLQKKSSG